jgi:uncharacterized protein YsxB (DUF464 family)
MIKIQINKTNNKYSSLVISGHSNYDEHGKDIVCAGVSAIVTGGLNALINENKSKNAIVALHITFSQLYRIEYIMPYSVKSTSHGR